MSLDDVQHAYTRLLQAMQASLACVAESASEDVERALSDLDTYMSALASEVDAGRDGPWSMRVLGEDVARCAGVLGEAVVRAEDALAVAEAALADATGRYVGLVDGHVSVCGQPLCLPGL